MANSRFYSSTAQETTLSAPINNSINTINVASTAGFPGSLPYTLAIDYETATEELVDVTAVGGTTLTVTRGVDGTSATSHNAGAVVRHVSSARDFTESRTHEASTTGVHGVTGVIVDTLSAQTLQNKTLANATGSLRNVDIFNGPTWQTAVIGETANDGITRFHVLDDETSLNEVWAISDRGNMVSRIQSSDGDGSYRIRVIATDGVTDRFAVLAGGAMTVAQNSTSTFPVLDVKPGDLSTTKRAIRIAANGGGNERFTVWNDGHTEITGTNAGQVTLNVKSPASPTASPFRVQDSASNVLFNVDTTGRTQARREMDIRAEDDGAEVVLRVFGNAGQSANLQNWIDGTGTTVASIDSAGHASFIYNQETTGVTPSSGWTVTTQRYREVAGVRYINIGLTRTGADIVVAANGNISPDLQIATIPAGWTPVDATPVNASTGVNNGTVRMNTDSTIDLTDWTPSQDIVTGNILRFNYVVIK